MKRLFPVLALALLAGCGGGSKASSAPSPTPTVQPGPANFTAQAHDLTFGSKDFESATDDQLLEVGNVACDGFGQGFDFARVVQAYVGSDAHPSTSEAEDFTRLAVTNLCPQYALQMP